MAIHDSDFILTYLGAIGTWYMPDEMLLFFKYLFSEKPNSKLLFITHEKKETIYLKAKQNDIPSEKIIVVKAERNEQNSFYS